ncbi:MULTISPECIES: TolC family outer membrane protein [Shewanella]|uniref:Type I secretion outer membrane protein, TolC family n=1 Tax=Shewanella loihica (strain ATCC BAA-1088 / PV-4) TaxID=323850 RepID=A3Q9N4_SHELP|nr:MULTISPECIES: TolC family outer membrane protein [Shewanella]ABO22182.1 type I secretion outer membrane protein, TolC family [Shewanella loihica PV-4]QYJ82742.1 TolC family outer membrane protein [Shewanella aegiceratis]QYJ94115.1 TolC family outer membrane protein [Shewanella spartinae]QYJ97972.1 TolC family outer membrane protein [Shewanella alkalitolerans]QYK13238.1 TolC family outer membrane protein [Shewanella rhizosphaerae]
MSKQTMHQLKRSAMALAISAMLIPGAASSQTLEQAVAHTLDTNPDIRIAFNRFKAREEQVNQAIAGYMPTVDISGGYGWEQTNSPSTRRRAGQGDVDKDGVIELMRGEVGFSIKQMLFDGFYTSSEVDRFSFEASADQWALFAAAEDIALDVAKVYVNYIRSEQVLTLAEKNLQSHKDIYDQIKQRTDSGLGSVADLSQITGRLARANANVIAAKNNFFDAKAQFIRIVEKEPENLIVPVPDDDMLPTNLTDGLKVAQENHPILKSAASDISAAENERSSAQSNYYPKLSLELGGNWNDNLDGEDGYSAFASQNVGGHNNDLIAMVRVKYNLFAGGKDLAREKEAAYKIGEAKEIRQRAYRQVVEGVNLAWNAYEMLEPQKLYIRDHVIAAKDTQVAYSQQFNLGQRTLLDLLDTENELFEARKDYLDAEYDEIISEYRILNATGRLLESLRVTRPEVWKGEREYEGGVK